MKISKRNFEIYKWLPFVLMVCYFSDVYSEGLPTYAMLVRLVPFVAFIVPYIFIHSIICRHIYTTCKKQYKNNDKEGFYYEF